jgi:hypothetical protein
MSTSAQVARELELDGIHCALTIRKFSNGTVILKIAGTDVGEFGERPMLELRECLRDAEPVHLFIDARDVRGASMNVSGAWAEWLGAHKMHFGTISMLTGSRYVEITADFVRRFAALEGIMRIYTDPEVFDGALSQSVC